MKKKELRLKVFESSESNFLMFSIFSYLNDYHLCWEVNKKFGIQLLRSSDYVVDEEKKCERAFSVYHFFSQDERRMYTLVSNKSENGPLMTELPKVDYFFRISGLSGNENERDVISRFRQIDNVVMTMNVEKHALNIRGKNTLADIFDTLC